MAKEGSNVKKMSRKERRVQQQRANRMRLFRIGGLVVLAILVLGAVGF